MSWSGYDNLNLPNEIWKEIAGYEGLYEVSNFGRVRSMPRVLVDCLGRSSRWRSKILSGGITEGYHMIMLCRPGEQYMESVARLVAMAFIPNPEGKPEVNHKSGNKSDNSVGNLEWNTHQENCAHRQKSLGKVVGENGPNSILTNAQVLEMRKLRKETGIGYKVIAERYGCKELTAWRAITGKTYPYLQ